MNEEEKKLNSVINAWFQFFSKMKVGEQIELAKHGKKNAKLFLDICRSFIDGNPEWQMTEDYLFIEKFTS